MCRLNHRPDIDQGYIDDVKDHTERNDEVLLIKRGIPSFDSWHIMGWNMYRYLEPNGRPPFFVGLTSAAGVHTVRWLVI